LVKDYNNRNAKERRYGFSILAIDCLLIETLQSFREGLTDSKGKLKNMFVNFLMIRCGILHQAEIMGETLLWSIGMAKGKKLDGTTYVNRTKFQELIKKEKDLYCEDLKDKDNIDIRKNFRKKALTKWNKN